MNTSQLSLCVYCGSREGRNPRYALAAVDQLPAGLADARPDRVGVIPQSLMQRELGHAGLDELHVVQTMHERKQMMAERSDAFLALPGGIGTFEELFEVWTWRQLGYHDKPVALLNVDGYYDPLIAFLAQTEQQGFVSPEQSRLLLVDSDMERLLARISEAAAQAKLPDDYRRI